MAAAASPAEWAWPNTSSSNTDNNQLPSSGSSNNNSDNQKRPLELQFLPPASAAAAMAPPLHPPAAAAPLPPPPALPPSSFSWGEDPLRLQQLMMGSLAAAAAAAAAASLSSSSSSSSFVSVAAPLSSSCSPATAAASSSSSSPTPSPSSSSSASGTTATISSAILSNSRASSTGASDVGALFDLDTTKPLPTGYERCLDLKSGQVFIKKREGELGANASPFAGKSSPVSLLAENKDLSGKQDWSLRWLLPKSTSPTSSQEAPNASATTFSFVCLEKRKKQPQLQFHHHHHHQQEEERRDGLRGNLLEDGSPRKEADETLCLDLDLKLTNQPTSSTRVPVDANNKITRDSKNAPFWPPRFNGSSGVPPSSTSSSSPSAAASSLSLSSSCVRQGFNTVQQQWKWDQFASHEKSTTPNSLQELVRESIMATAACSKCLMYVLLKKSNPTCPRCGNHIVLDYNAAQFQQQPQHISFPAPHKRPRLDGAQGWPPS